MNDRERYMRLYAREGWLPGTWVKRHGDPTFEEFQRSMRRYRQEEREYIDRQFDEFSVYSRQWDGSEPCPRCGQTIVSQSPNGGNGWGKNPVEVHKDWHYNNDKQLGR